jgi:single-strand DNA-binding protein
MSLATTDRYLSGKEWKSETQWHNVVAWGKTADYIHQNVKKGNEVALIGKLQYRSFENKEGVKQTITEIVVNEFVKISKEV